MISRRVRRARGENIYPQRPQRPLRDINQSVYNL